MSCVDNLAGPGFTHCTVATPGQNDNALHGFFKDSFATPHQQSSQAEKSPVSSSAVLSLRQKCSIRPLNPSCFSIRRISSSAVCSFCSSVARYGLSLRSNRAGFSSLVLKSCTSTTSFLNDDGLLNMQSSIFQFAMSSLHTPSPRFNSKLVRLVRQPSPVRMRRLAGRKSRCSPSIWP